MILRALTVISLIAALLLPADAQERVTVGTLRQISNGALFIAALQGYFKAEGLDVEMTAYASPQQVAQALAAGATDFGLAEFSAAAFTFAGQGMIKAIAAQVREKKYYEGNDIVVSNGAYASGRRDLRDLANTTFAVSELGSTYHYQLGQIARIKGFNLTGITLKSVQTVAAMARAVGTGEADATILPAQYARELLVANQAKLVGWYSDFDEAQLGALFTTAKMLQSRRATVEKFVRAYRRGAADYAAGLLRHDRQGKHISDAKSQATALLIARYVYPGLPRDRAIITVENATFYMDSQARLDVEDIARQVEWYKAQGLIAASIDASNVVDSTFTK